MITASRILLAALLLPLSLTGCDIFDKRSRRWSASDRRVLRPARDRARQGGRQHPGHFAGAGRQRFLAAVGGFANYAMQHLAIGDSPQVVWTADVGSGSSSRAS